MVKKSKQLFDFGKIFQKLAILCMLLLLIAPQIGFAEVKNENISLKVEDINKILYDLPGGERWIKHLNEDLIPFWTMPEALGKDGKFPTYRCNDGSLYDDKKNACKELKEADPSIVNLDREFMRSESRQIFVYGVAYHLTGEEKYLQYATDGVKYLTEKVLVDKGKGGAITYFDKNTGPCPKEQRISQDMAYILCGLSFYYNLTRDPVILEQIVNLKNYIFKTYYQKDEDLLKWILAESKEGDKPNQKELVSQLDQVYAYMLWLTPTLSDAKLKDEWKNDLVHLAHLMIEQFYGQKYNLFWGAVTDSTVKNLGTGHTDFGHSTKTLWMIYQIGKMTGNFDLVDFARPRILERIEMAYIEDTGSWARGFKKDAGGKNWIIDQDKEWWACAIMDQVTATMSLVEPVYAKYLVNTNYYWFEYMVDHKNHEMWHMVKAADNLPDLSVPKQHSWKNAWHSFEHCLVAYITSQQLHNQPVTLYYAFKDNVKVADENIQPYLYAAKIASKSAPAKFNSKELAGYEKYTYVFTDIR